ncbi:MAG TPA: cyclic nucleotide-binding domain-containing protein [Actinomycetota bacterium]|jgi:CRP-like cAMP-binding protein
MKDVLDSLAGLVPPSISSARAPSRPAAGRTRTDRPLGKRGLDLLARVPLFGGLSRRHLRAMADRADQVEFRAGEAIVVEGMRGGAFFAIVEGKARVTRGKRTLAMLGPGDFFGELALLDGGQRSASVVAATPMLCIRIFKRAFDRLIAEEPGVSARMLSVLAGRLRRTERPPAD